MAQGVGASRREGRVAARGDPQIPRALHEGNVKMPSYIVKASPDEDFYVMWSTIVDAPIAWGSREDLTREARDPRDVAAERFDRADHNGTSAAWPDWPAEDQPYVWGDSEGFMLGEVGPECEDGTYILPRANLRVFCERLETDERGVDTADLLTFERHA